MCVCVQKVTGAKERSCFVTTIGNFTFDVLHNMSGSSDGGVVVAVAAVDGQARLC